MKKSRLGKRQSKEQEIKTVGLVLMLRFVPWHLNKRNCIRVKLELIRGIISSTVFGGLKTEATILGEVSMKCDLKA